MENWLNQEVKSHGFLCNLCPWCFHLKELVRFCDIHMHGFLVSNVDKFSPSLIGVKGKHCSCGYLSLYRSHFSVVSFVVYTCCKVVSQNYHKKWVKSIKKAWLASNCQSLHKPAIYFFPITVRVTNFVAYTDIFA